LWLPACLRAKVEQGKKTAFNANTVALQTVQLNSAQTVHLLWLPARLSADVGRDVGLCLPGLTGRLRGGLLMVMPRASSLGANHDPQSEALLPLFINSCITM